MSDPNRTAAALSPWFEANARDMTWRRTRDPWAIWVSEIMLQQTRVDTVERYFSGFMARFPTVDDLAAADVDEVLEAWSGLGYYRRARLLHRGARYVRDEEGSVVPSERKSLRAVPGVGPYTAGAIASIAFDRPEALVDGNVARVSSRLRAIEEPKAQDAGHADHWSWVQAVLEAGSPRVLAQALMELGATVCTPRAPRCDACPLASQCQARAQGLQEIIPAPKRRKASPEDELWGVALLWGDRALLERRPSEGLLAGMWCLPLVARADVKEQGLLTWARERFGVDVRAVGPLGTEVRHVFTHRVWKIQVWGARARRRPALRGASPELAWYGPDASPSGGVPTATRKMLRRVDQT